MRFKIKNMLKIYHNPRCSKSREALQLLQEAKCEFETILYMENPLTSVELESITEKLGIATIDLVRKNEVLWKEKFKGKILTDKELIAAMIAYPKLMERPIVVSDENAVLGRPPENIKALFKN